MRIARDALRQPVTAGCGCAFTPRGQEPVARCCPTRIKSELVPVYDVRRLHLFPLQVSPSLAHKFQQSAQHQQQHQQQLDQLSLAAAAAAAGARVGNIHVSDSASSMSSVAGQANQLLAAAAAGRSGLGQGHGHAHSHVHKAVPSLATLSEAQALDDTSALYAAAAGQMLAGAGRDQPGAGGPSAADVNATANVLMGLQLSAAAGQAPTPEQQLWALQMAGAAAQGLPPGAGAAGGLWGAAAANQLYGAQAGAGMPGAAAAAAANLQALRNLQELQLRQQQQQQQLAMAANLATLQGQALSASDLNAAAAQLLHIAGLGGALGSAGTAGLGVPHAAAGLGLGMGGAAGLSANLGNAAAAQQLLQQALAMGNVNALSALSSMQAALGGAAAGRLGGGSFGGLGGLGGGGPGGHHGHGHGSRDGGSGRPGGGRLSRRTTDPAAELERKMQQEKLYALDPVKIRGGEDKRTTLMIKNIPNKYTQKMLLATIDDQFKGTYDFFYLPIDFKNKCNVGYAFINMINPFDIIPFVERFNNRRWERFNSEKVCSISYARIQGRAALVAHFQNSSLMHEDKRCRPILFTANGTETTDQEAFQNDPSLQPPPGQGSSSSAPGVPGGSAGAGAGPSGSGVNLSSGGSSAAALAAVSGPARLRAAAAAAAAAGGSTPGGSSGSLASGMSVGQLNVGGGAHGASGGALDGGHGGGG